MDNQNRVDKVIEGLKPCIPKLGKQSQRVAVGIYKGLAEGIFVNPKKLSQKMDLPPNLIEEILESFTGIYKDESKNIVGFWGLTVAMDTPHKFIVDGKEMNAWCAWDTLFLPEIIGKEARIESVCPISGKKIELTVSPEGIKSFSPQKTVLSFLIPDSLEENVINKFCHFIHFFSSEEAFEKWQINQPNTFSISLEEGFLIGKKKNSLKLGLVLDVDKGGTQ
ncbi:MAG: hypothetical protein CL675_05515 [Bdellovibrionaceae bacterium]|nr:hypothetical protein [Pseudobdellovibrionaceae bacterium]